LQRKKILEITGNGCIKRTVPGIAGMVSNVNTHASNTRSIKTRNRGLVRSTTCTSSKVINPKKARLNIAFVLDLTISCCGDLASRGTKQISALLGGLDAFVAGSVTSLRAQSTSAELKTLPCVPAIF